MLSPNTQLKYLVIEKKNNVQIILEKLWKILRHFKVKETTYDFPENLSLILQGLREISENWELWARPVEINSNLNVQNEKEAEQRIKTTHYEGGQMTPLKHNLDTK